MAFTHWHVVAIATCSDAASGTAPCVVMERNFNRWGLMALGTAPGSTVPSSTLRKGVGDLASMQQPWFNFTGSDPEYFEKIENALVDYAAQQAATRTTDGQLTFSSIASTLAPQRDIVEIGNAADVVKFVVVHTGRVKCAVRKNTATLTEGGITELQNQHSPPPNAQTLVFDPAKHVSYWPERFQATKTTLVGGHLNIANVGSFSTSVSKGFELVAFVPEADMQPVGPATEAATCQYSAAIKNAYIADYTPGGRVTAPTLPAAQAACDANIDCGGITLRYGAYELRAASYTQPSTVGEVSWLVLNSSKPACHAMPRIDGVNYAPGVFIRLREQLSQTWGAADSISYFWVTNATAQSPMVVNASVFYGALSKHTANVRSLLAPTIDVTLPGAEGARQVDTAKFGLLSAMSNFIGNQPNYGNGGTYWSIGREDNGSLPLDFLTVDDALLDWGMLEVAREHVGFYLDNYVRDDGTVNYYTWGDLGDSVGDTGRIVSVFLKVVRLGGDSGTAKAWATHYLPKAQALGRLMLREIAAQQSVPPPDGCQGLLQGAPEHDWSSVTNLYFYNNNAWVMRGLHELGTYLSSGTAPLNATGGAAMLTAAAKLLGDIQASVKKCLVFAHDGTPFLPPNAEIGATPFQNMTGDRTSSYSNFRFFSETLLADIMPRDVEGGWLTYHNERGGRAGGANRFMSWLDDSALRAFLCSLLFACYLTPVAAFRREQCRRLAGAMVRSLPTAPTTFWLSCTGIWPLTSRVAAFIVRSSSASRAKVSIVHSCIGTRILSHPLPSASNWSLRPVWAALSTTAARTTSVFAS